MHNLEPITVHVDINAPLSHVWECFTSPAHITKWAFASDDWEAPRRDDVRVGGKFLTRMSAKDGSAGFDFTGVYTDVVEHGRIAYAMEDGRTVEVTFVPLQDSVRVVETFDPESENSRELQTSGWQAILENFKKHTERTLS